MKLTHPTYRVSKRFQKYSREEADYSWEILLRKNPVLQPYWKWRFRSHRIYPLQLYFSALFFSIFRRIQVGIRLLQITRLLQI